uniref:Peptidase M1 leukotriene A4 hydrolase/aminopeptidase C-terminal domain-containing protein n=1 Tax=Ditylum brightwellii TaxID=49249 RepID=A0A7S2EUF7_9STRA|mmetsp:Transcript_884/g.1417  ORF Transcript_884/g.1417 Transcript_884/m.1417 type:complete len:668 (+) Transcript_884:86-2089(+)
MANSTDLDSSTLSNNTQTVTRHLEWKASISFEARNISATASYKVEILDKCATCVQLDTRGLDIQSVSVNGTAVPNWKLGCEVKGKNHLGQRLSVPLPVDDSYPLQSSTFDLEISYTTSSDGSRCTAVQWLPPAQTAGKKRPFLFTQCYAIHARSIVPCMDCPAVKMTYRAAITVPYWSTAVMSAIGKGSIDNGDGTTMYSFDQPVAMPSYLLALAVGDIASCEISPRCKVWSEPSLLDACKFEFSQTESFLQIAEEITDMPYQWVRYDLLCLPPSFPYGGAENPCLTFVTPTLLAGDRSLASVVAHEIAHSWTGNLVTNRTWSHFWLNEGWTKWLERKIISKIHNDDRFFDFDAIGGWKALQEDVSILPAASTCLVLDLGDSDPDESYSIVPYEKGFHLLWNLERMIGSTTFLCFARAYLKKFAFVTVTSEEFRDFLDSFLEGNIAVSQMVLKHFDWEEWLHGEGMPPCGEPKFDRTLSGDAEALAKEWITYDEKGASVKQEPPSVDISEWTSSQKVCFLDAIMSGLENRNPFKTSTTKVMQDLYKFHETKNCEILYRLCMIGVSASDENIYPVVVRFITTQGRMKYIRPLYRALFATEKGKGIAIQAFLEHKDFYHPIAAKMIAMDLGAAVTARNKGEKNIPYQTLFIGTLAVVSIGAVVLARRKK